MLTGSNEIFFIIAHNTC